MAVLTYKCPNCDGGLVFDPESGKYVCEYCMSKFSQEELQFEKEDEQISQEHQEVTQTEEEQSNDFSGALEYHCPSCGAEIITDETTAATFCFYCHNPIVLSGKLEGTFLPDGIIPFKITKDEATQKFHEWIQRKKFIPTGFYSKRQIEKLTGVYFPYWIYDCETDSTLNGTAKNIRIWRVGDIEYTETKIYSIRRAGKVSFRHLPKTALQKAQNAMLKGIFPYNFGVMEPFHMGFLSGFQAEKRDIEKDVLIDEISRDIQMYAEKRMRDTVTGYQSFSADHRSCSVEKENIRYTLLPVWILTYREKGNDIYYFAMNGQTGEIIGKLPVDKKKMFFLGAGLFIAVFALVMMGGLLL